MESEQSQSDPNGKPTFRDRRYPWIIWAERAQQTILLTLYAVLNPNPPLPPSLQGSQHRAAALGTATRFGCCHLLRHQEQGTRVGQSPPIHAHCSSQAPGAALPQPHSLQLLLCLVRAAGEQSLPASFASLSLVEVLTSKFKFSHLKGEPNPNCVLQLYYCSYTECHIL